MANEKWLISVDDCPCDGCKAKPCGHPARCVKFALWLNKTVDAYTAEQVSEIIRQAEAAKDENGTLRTGLGFLKNCINCKIRNTCPRHCGKVVHDCDHWEYGDPAQNAAPVVHGRWEGPFRVDANHNGYKCSKCGFFGVPGWVACPKCGAKMDGENNGQV